MVVFETASLNNFYAISTLAKLLSFATKSKVVGCFFLVRPTDSGVKKTTSTMQGFVEYVTLVISFTDLQSQFCGG